jgi:hypothetical protein
MHQPTGSSRQRHLGGPALATILIVLFVGACSTSAAPALSPGPGAASPSAAVTGRPSFTVTTPGAPTSGPSASAAGQAPDSPCAKVSTDDVESVTGATSITFSTAGSDDDIACDWLTTPDGLVIVEVFSGVSAQVEDAGAWPLFQKDPAVDGVGDEAHWDPSGKLLLVKDGDSFVLFSVGMTANPNDQSATVTFARLVEPKLDL